MAEPRRRVRRRVSQRYLDAPYDYYGRGCPVAGFFRAAAYATAEAFAGMSRVAGDLAVDTSDSFAGRRSVWMEYELDEEPDRADLRVGRDAPADSIEFEEEEDVFLAYDEDDRPIVVRSFCGSFDQAFVDSSRVFSRSARLFADELDAERAYIRRPVRYARGRGKRTRVRREETVTTEVSEEPTPTSATSAAPASAAPASTTPASATPPSATPTSPPGVPGP